MKGELKKEVLAALVKKATGNRSINQYALHSGVSSGHISRLGRGIINSPPLPETLKKLADKAHNGVTYEEFMYAAGHWTPDSDMLDRLSKIDLDLPFKQKNLADALLKISEMVFEYNLTERMAFDLITKAMKKYGPAEPLPKEKKAARQKPPSKRT